MGMLKEIIEEHITTQYTRAIFQLVLLILGAVLVAYEFGLRIGFISLCFGYIFMSPVD